jgi:hypothetical protein
VAEYRAVITKALLHTRLLQILDGATTSLSEVRNLAKLRIPETIEEKRKLDGIESDLLMKNARMGVTSTQLLLSRLRKTDGPGEAPAPAPPVKLGIEDIYAILHNGRSVSMAEVDSIVKRADELGLSSYQVEQLKTMMRNAYATVVRTVNRGAYPIPVGLPATENPISNDQEVPDYSWIGRRKPPKKRER